MKSMKSWRITIFMESTFYMWVHLKRGKNVLTLLEAYYHYGTSKQLVLAVGGKAYLSVIKEKIKSYGLEKEVVILENIDQVDLPALYQGAFAFCFPSFFEGFGIPIIESLFSGTLSLQPMEVVFLRWQAMVVYTVIQTIPLKLQRPWITFK